MSFLKISQSGYYSANRERAKNGGKIPFRRPWHCCEWDYFVSLSTSSQPVIIALRWLLQVWPVVMM